MGSDGKTASAYSKSCKASEGSWCPCQGHPKSRNASDGPVVQVLHAILASEGSNSRNATTTLRPTSKPGRQLPGFGRCSAEALSSAQHAALDVGVSRPPRAICPPARIEIPASGQKQTLTSRGIHVRCAVITGRSDGGKVCFGWQAGADRSPGLPCSRAPLFLGTASSFQSPHAGRRLGLKLFASSKRS